MVSSLKTNTHTHTPKHTHTLSLTDTQRKTERSSANSIVYMYHNFIIHSSADEYRGLFYFLAIMNRSVRNMMKEYLGGRM